jgi:copper chaperone CopZ
MRALIILLLLTTSMAATAQVTGAKLQASGLTCSMCSKAVKNALDKVPSVEAVQVDIKNQTYNLRFREGVPVSLDELSKAVEDAGFSVASLKVTALVDVTLEKDEHIRIGDAYFHFLNASNQKLSGPVTFAVVDKSFVPAKEFRKYSAMSKMTCVQTGKAASCCTKESTPEGSRIYHAII